VIAPFGSSSRTFCVIAIAAFAIVVPPNTIAQDAPAPPWWRKLQVPDSHIRSTLLQNVLATPVSTFDGRLPPIRLDDWLFATLAPRVEVLRTPLVDWDVTFCHAYADGPNPSIVTASGPELCAKGSIRVSAERNIHLVILVANAVRGARAWHPTPPAMRDVYIERMKELSPTDSFDVSDLGGLPDLLQVPFDQWPKVRFKTEIVWDPPKPLPGDTVRFSITK
jgi:hypothetical protein